MRNSVDITHNVKQLFKEYPITSGLITLFCVIHFLLNNWIYLQYNFLRYLDMYPICNIFAVFVHIDMSHLLMNSLSLYQFRYIEKKYGRLNYCTTLIYFVIMTKLLLIYVDELFNYKVHGIGF